MSSGNYNMEDPAAQEKVRRGHHEYIPTAGKHGTYVTRIYKHQEYPKMMLKEPKPVYADFVKVNGVSIPQDIALVNYQAAMTDWDQRMVKSVVNNKAEEQQWLKENG